MKIVYRAGDITEAQIVRGMLLANDIEAHVSGFYLQGGIGEMAATDFAKVHVPDKDVEGARELLREYEGNQGDNFEPTSTTSKTAHRPNFLITIIVVIIVSILSFWIGI